MKEFSGGLRVGDSLGNRMAYFLVIMYYMFGSVELGGNNSKDYYLYYLCVSLRMD